MFVCFCFLLLYNKLPQKLVASNDDYVVMSHNSVGQEFKKGTESIVLAAPCGTCRSWAIQDSFFTYMSGTSSIRVNQMAGAPQVFISWSWASTSLCSFCIWFIPQRSCRRLQEQIALSTFQVSWKV